MDDLTEKVSEKSFLRGEPSTDFERYNRDRCRNRNGPCYSCQIYVLACPEVIKALSESCRGIMLEACPNALLTFNILKI